MKIKKILLALLLTTLVVGFTFAAKNPAPWYAGKYVFKKDGIVSNLTLKKRAKGDKIMISISERFLLNNKGTVTTWGNVESETEDSIVIKDTSVRAFGANPVPTSSTITVSGDSLILDTADGRTREYVKKVK